MKIILVGAHGTIGQYVKATLMESGHQIIGVGRKSGDYNVHMEDPESVARLFENVGNFDAVVNAAGEVAFAPLTELSANQWNMSWSSKLMGQIHLVQKAIPYINERGSFTLVSGVLGVENILGGTAAATINGAVEAFVKAASIELPKGLRINAICPTLLEDSVKNYENFFPGFIPVDGKTVAAAFKKSVMGAETGCVYRVL